MRIATLLDVAEKGKTRTFLVVDDNPENRFLLTKTLMRKFAGSVCLECADLEAAVKMARKLPLDAAVVHRAGDADAIPLIEALRKACPTLPLVLVSGMDRSAEGKKAGASAFLNYDAWLNVGTVVDGLMKK